MCDSPPGGLSPLAASEAVLDLGGLARWVLRPEVLESAAEAPGVPEELRAAWRGRPALPGEHGSCWVAFVADPAERPGLFREAFVLPLCWREGEEDAETLPAGLREAAGAARDAVGVGGWGLWPAEEWRDVDLRDMPLCCASGWAALAAGLRVAGFGDNPSPRVWASGGWAPGVGVKPVRDLAAKIRLAAEFGAEQFFVPASQAEEAERLVPAGSGLVVRKLAEGRPDAIETLRDYCDALDLPPDAAAPRERRAAYYLRRPDARRGYYLDNLLPEVTAGLRRAWEEAGGGRCTHLVTIASDSPELVAMAVRVVRPETCLVLYTADKAGNLALIRDLLGADVPSDCLRPKCFPDADALLEGLVPLVRAVIAGTRPGEVVFDLTPGSKEMSLVQALEGARPGDRLYYLRHGYENRRPKPFSERLRVWKGGERITGRAAPG